MQEQDKSNKDYGLPIRRNGWIKSFWDFTTEHGYDDLVAAGMASWSRGRLTNIRSVSLIHNCQRICLYGDGLFWQSDDFDAVVGTNETTIVARRIEKCLTLRDNIIGIYRGKSCTCIHVLTGEQDMVDIEERIQITDEDRGKWLVLEYNVLTDTVYWYLSEAKI